MIDYNMIRMPRLQLGKTLCCLPIRTRVLSRFVFSVLMPFVAVCRVRRGCAWKEMGISLVMMSIAVVPASGCP